MADEQDLPGTNPARVTGDGEPSDMSVDDSSIASPTGEGTDHDSGAGESGDMAAGRAGEPDASSAATAWSRVVRARNRAVIGRLRVSFPERDVTVVMDGDAALRTVAAFASPSSQQRWADLLDPDVCDAKWNAWIGLDLAAAIAVIWVPGDGSETAGPARFVVDPPVG